MVLCASSWNIIFAGTLYGTWEHLVLFGRRLKSFLTASVAIIVGIYVVAYFVKTSESEVKR